MESHHKPSVMSQNIFKLGLSLETVSVYLLCCAMADAGASITTRGLTDKWNSSKETLSRGLQELVDRNIICRILSDREGNEAYKVSDEKNWVN